jgi:hypothetical protein
MTLNKISDTIVKETHTETKTYTKEGLEAAKAFHLGEAAECDRLLNGFK